MTAHLNQTGPHVGVAEYQPDDEEDEAQSKEVNVRIADQGCDGGASVQCSDLMEVVEA